MKTSWKFNYIYGTPAFKSVKHVEVGITENVVSTSIFDTGGALSETHFGYRGSID
jgi:hypothetical protein